MAQQTINIGASPNDGTGTPLRTAFQYTNSNFSELYTAVGPSGNNIVVPGNATITGDLTVDTSTLKVDSANNRVGIGIATPNRNAVVYAAASPVLQICDSTTGTTANDGLLITQAGVDTFIENAEIGAMNFRTSAVTRYQIDSTGVSTWSVGGSTAMTLNSTGLGVGVTPSAGRGAIQLSAGVGFPATQVASSNANTLDDYEEGTWTPVVTAGTGTLTSVTGQTGAYTKVGRMVVVTGFFTVTTNGTGGSFLAVAGLPFTNGNLTNIAVGRIDGTTGEMFQGKLNPATNTVNLWKYDNSYPAADGAQFPMTLTYYV